MKERERKDRPAGDRERTQATVTEYLAGEWVTYHPTRFEVRRHEAPRKEES
jgi:hypothetical protein